MERKFLIECPNCGCPISSESTNQPEVVKEEKVVEDVVYYDKNIDGIQCKLTSSLWRFGDNITIPVKSVSAVVREQYFMPTWLKVLMLILSLLCTLFVWEIAYDWDLFDIENFLILGGAFLLFYLPFYLHQHDRIVVISHSGVRTSAIKYRHINDDLAPLYDAALKCLKENTK